MQAAADASMAAWSAFWDWNKRRSRNCASEARGDWTLEIANLLCPGNIVVSGTTVACERIADLANAAGAMKVIPLAVAGAFHTSLMESAVERLRRGAGRRLGSRSREFRWFRTSTPGRTIDPDGDSRAFDPAGLLASSLGRFDALHADGRWKSRSFTNSAPAGC